MGRFARAKQLISLGNKGLSRTNKQYKGRLPSTTNLGVGGSNPPRRANLLVTKQLESRSSSAADQWPDRGETGIRIGAFSASRFARTTVLSGSRANRSGNLVK
ncbi:hypothetical protein N8071_00640 [bacterium]|nr:hypothetical protein [bacterium]